jgi:hypothetical protein
MSAPYLQGSRCSQGRLRCSCWRARCRVVRVESVGEVPVGVVGALAVPAGQVRAMIGRAGSEIRMVPA